MKTPVRVRGVVGHAGRASASAATCSMSNCCGSISCNSRGGMRKRSAATRHLVEVEAGEGVASSPVAEPSLSGRPTSGAAAAARPRRRRPDALLEGRSDAQGPKWASMPDDGDGRRWRTA